MTAPVFQTYNPYHPGIKLYDYSHTMAETAQAGPTQYFIPVRSPGVTASPELPGSSDHQAVVHALHFNPGASPQGVTVTFQSVDPVAATINHTRSFVLGLTSTRPSNPMGAVGNPDNVLFATKPGDRLAVVVTSGTAAGHVGNVYFDISSINPKTQQRR